MIDKTKVDKEKRQLQAKQRIRSMRDAVENNIEAKREVANLVKEYVRQRPEVTVQIIQKWLGK